MSVQIGKRKLLDVTDRLGTDVLHGTESHTVVDDVHDPGSKTGYNDHDKDPGKVIPHPLEVYLMFCNDLVDRVTKQYRHVELKDYGDCGKDDTEDQEQTVSSNETEYLPQSFCAVCI